MSDEKMGAPEPAPMPNPWGYISRDLAETDRGAYELNIAQNFRAIAVCARLDRIIELLERRGEVEP